ncbi:hypothetical protein [Kutzneria kofuensis]
MATVSRAAPNNPARRAGPASAGSAASMPSPAAAVAADPTNTNGISR